MILMHFKPPKKLNFNYFLLTCISGSHKWYLGLRKGLQQRWANTTQLKKPFDLSNHYFTPNSFTDAYNK